LIAPKIPFHFSQPKPFFLFYGSALVRNSGGSRYNTRELIGQKWPLQGRGFGMKISRSGAMPHNFCFTNITIDAAIAKSASNCVDLCQGKPGHRLEQKTDCLFSTDS